MKIKFQSSSKHKIETSSFASFKQKKRKFTKKNLISKIQSRNASIVVTSIVVTSIDVTSIVVTSIDVTLTEKTYTDKTSTNETNTIKSFANASRVEFETSTNTNSNTTNNASTSTNANFEHDINLKLIDFRTTSNAMINSSTITILIASLFSSSNFFFIVISNVIFVSIFEFLSISNEMKTKINNLITIIKSKIFFFAFFLIVFSLFTRFRNWRIFVFFLINHFFVAFASFVFQIVFFSISHHFNIFQFDQQAISKIFVFDFDFFSLHLFNFDRLFFEKHIFWNVLKQMNRIFWRKTKQTFKTSIIRNKNFKERSKDNRNQKTIKRERNVVDSTIFFFRHIRRFKERNNKKINKTK